MKLTTRALANAKLTFKLAWERARKYNAIPKWSKTSKNKNRILHIYISAQIRNLTSKTKFEVDHIIPLYNEKVCGLHVKENLQVLSKNKNEAKSNYFRCYREIDGQKIYLERGYSLGKSPKISKKYNQTKKNPTKLAKKRSKITKNQQKFVVKKYRKINK